MEKRDQKGLPKLEVLSPEFNPLVFNKELKNQRTEDLTDLNKIPS